MTIEIVLWRVFTSVRLVCSPEGMPGPGRVPEPGPGTVLLQRDHGRSALLGLPVPGQGSVRAPKSRQHGLPPPPTAIRGGGEGDGKGERAGTRTGPNKSPLRGRAKMKLCGQESSGNKLVYAC